MRRLTFGLDGVPVAPGDTVVTADPHDDELAVCGTLVRQHGRWLVARASGDLMPVDPARVQRV